MESTSLPIGTMIIFAAGAVAGCVGAIGLAATCVPVDEARLPRLLAKARRQFAVDVSGPLPVSVVFWFTRLGSACFVAVSQFAVFKGATGLDFAEYGPIVLALAALEVATVTIWSIWVCWAFARAASRTGSLSLTLDPAVQPSKYSTNDQRGWAESANEEGPSTVDETKKV
jgi:hypothetical protein